MSNVGKRISRRAALRGTAVVLTMPLLEQTVLTSVLAGTAADSAPAQPMTEIATSRGHWHDAKCCVGFHFDLHVTNNDTDIGARCNPEELARMLELAGATYVQTDSKGHPGLTSWFSKTPAAAIGPGVVNDWVLAWRKATKELGLPLHCHYSGIWDVSAGSKHPEWCIVGSNGTPVNTGGCFGMKSPSGDKMCPRGPYVDELMIPQMMELIDHYGVDGFWIDGDLWGMHPCYCSRCRAAFKAKTGIAEPPEAQSDPHWPQWWNFTRESFEQYVTHYCDAVHRHKPGVLVCSNWLQTFQNPGEPQVPTDWISGDNASTWALDNSRCEARFISTRGKPWDLMLWVFYAAHSDLGRPDWQMKPVQMLQQEAATVVALGGGIQTCENPFGGARDGRLVPWRVRRIGEMAAFVKARREMCQGAETIPQIAVLHSEHHAYSRPSGPGLMNIDVTSVRGAVGSLLECHYGVDVLDEWALLPRLSHFPVVVVPGQERMSQAMLDALKEYVGTGGKLLVAGVAVLDRFGDKFLGVEGSRLVSGNYYVPVEKYVVPIATEWRLVDVGKAECLGKLGASLFPGEQLLPNPSATLNRLGRGAVAYVPCDIFREFATNRYQPVRVFIHEVLRALAGEMEIEVHAPTCVDVVLRRTGAKRMVHLINRSSGIPNLPNSVVIDEIPPVGPVAIRMSLDRKPKGVSLAFEKAAINWDYTSAQNAGQLKIDVAAVHIHAAIVVEEDA